MKRVHSALLLASLVLCTAGSGLKASLDFGSKDSKISIASGGTLHVNTNNMSIDGTLEVASGAMISSRDAGAFIAFNNGVLSSDGLDATLTGSFNPTGTDTINLSGNGRFNVQPGTIIQSVNVSGVGNIISGQPSFSSPLVLADENTVLTLSIQGGIDQDIQLNGGALALADNLMLADNAQLAGTGAIQLNKRRLDLGSTYTSPWRSALTFYDALDLTLNGSVNLSGVWGFFGANVVNGNSSVLDLSSGGQVWAGFASTLQLNSIVIKGIGDADDNGKLAFFSTDGVIKTSGTTLQFDSNYTLTGTLYISGPTTLALGRNNIIISDSGNLVVDGTTLWLDPLDSKSNPGTVYVPQNGLGRITYLNGGTIQAVDSKGISSLSILTNQLAGNIVLDSSVILEPGQRMVVNGNVSIDGNGSYIEFMDPNFPQLVMQPGSHLTLKNIEFRNMKTNSLDLRATGTDIARAIRDSTEFPFSSARILIDQNVKWELDQDLTFTNGTIEVLDGNEGHNVFVMCSKTVPKTFYVAPLLDPFGGTSLDHALSFALGQNTLQLENIVFRGLGHVLAQAAAVVPVIALSGNATVDQDVQSNTINLFVENDNNYLSIRNALPDSSGNPVYTEFELASNITFGDYPVNHLTVSFSSTATTQAMLTINNDPGISLTSVSGIASLEFADQNVILNLANSNAFIIDSHANLKYNNLFIQNFPIKQQASDFLVQGNTLTNAGIDASFSRFPGNVRRSAPRNALQVKRAAAAAVAHASGFVNKVRPAKQASATHAPKSTVKAKAAPKAKVAPKAKRMRKTHHRGLDELLELHDDELADEMMTRATRADGGVVIDASQPAFALPALFGTTKNNGQEQTSSGYVDNCRFLNYKIGGYSVDVSQETGFSVQSGKLFNGLCANTSMNIIQDMTFDADRRFNFAGTDNFVAISSNVTVNCTADSLSGWGFAKNTELVVQLVGDGSLTLTGDLVLPEGCRLVIEGENNQNPYAQCIFADGFTCELMAAANKSNRSSFELLNGINARANSFYGNGVRFFGVGRFVVGQNVELSLSDNTMIFGGDSATDIDLTDILFEIQNNSSIFLTPGFAHTGTVSFRYGTFYIDLRGLIDIAGGIFALNAMGASDDGEDVQATPGRVVLVDLSRGGKINVRSSGTLVIGQNEFVRDLSYGPPTADFLPMGWDGHNAVFSADGTGKMQCVDVDGGYNRSLNGLIAQFPENFTSVDFIDTADQLVLPALQRVSGITGNTVYVASDGLTKVRSANGLMTAVLAADTTLVSESVTESRGVVVGDTVSGSFNGTQCTLDMLAGKIVNGPAAAVSEFIAAPSVMLN